MDTDPDRDTGKTCLGRGMHCPSASSLKYIIFLFAFSFLVSTVVDGTSTPSVKESSGG